MIQKDFNNLMNKICKKELMNICIRQKMIVRIVGNISGVKLN